MGLLDYMEGAKNKLAGLLGEMPISRMIHQGVQPPTVNGLRDALYAMPKPFNADDQAANEAAMAFWNPAGLLGKIVYHGSPHKFTKFDASKIGTGEGAQAYGHGVYLADAENVAKEYAAANAGRAAAKSGFLDSLPPGAQVDVMKIMDQKHRGPLARAQLERVKDRLSPEQYEAVVREFDAGGALYKADLPDEWIPKMLDWDKPLSQQPENVRLLAQDLGLAKDATGKDVYSALSNQARDMGIIKGQNAQTTLPGSQSRAATDLREFGIPGIRYLDGGSRPNSGRITMLEQTIANLKGKGASQAAIANTQRELDAELARASYNYVVFPGLEDQVKILERNGKGLLDY